jgi:ketosteroid isomerase-like protein
MKRISGTTGRAAKKLAGLLALLCAGPCTTCARAQDIPLVESCRTLAAVDVMADQRALRLLVDTGATSSLLDARMFRGGDAAHVVMHSWNGRSTPNARAAEISDLAIGGRHVSGVSFLTFDLSELGRECGKQIDGIMGADLIKKLGLEIDLKKRVVRFAADPKGQEQETDFPDLSEQFALCGAAFNRSDEKTFRDCLDPDVVLVVSGEDYRGRDAVLKYFDHEYFDKSGSSTMAIDRSAYHVIGGVAWHRYEIRTRLHKRMTKVHGTALFEKSGAKWLVMNLDHSVAQ